MLRFQRRMVGNLPFAISSDPRFDHVTKWLRLRNSSQPSGLPFSQIVLDAPIARLSEQPPRLPARARHDRHLSELLLGILRAIAAAQCLNKADDLAAFFEA